MPGLCMFIEQDLMAPYIRLYVMTPILVHLMSNDLRLMLVTAVRQIATNLTIYRSVLLLTFSTSNIELIVEKLVVTNFATIIFLTTLLGFLIRAMNQTAKDLAHSGQRFTSSCMDYIK